MDQVEAVACDMNSDFQEAFEEKCPHIQPVFDYFHIVKNFNDKVVSEVRKDEQRRLYEEGNVEAARALKKTRYILMSSRKTLQSKDADAREERQIHKGSSLFKTDSIVRKEGYEERYDALLQENQLLFTLDLIKEKLNLAYSRKDEAIMAEDIISIMDMCKATGNHTSCGLSVCLATTLRALSPTQLMISQLQRLKVSTTKSRLFADRDTDILMTNISF